ncbi:helix-turn-helix domain-containing protein [Aurantibacter crassamenti]|uniref:helix-turn-helix domain-containing protein n=1 Tax=Aurantibacter crassamenti TaxID=1837375 RepID=UPI00193A8399|nr:helix-turn-helix transcriptional regulator [Aurantibacter crassamenti]MBM1108229.1 helix-turn-helix domain-containing protein [Aurantibacter crassamenti]
MGSDANEDIPVYNKIPTFNDIKIEPFDITKRYTKPHKHNKYLEIAYFTQGSGFHFLDLNPLEIKPPIVFLIHKNQVHHWSIDSLPEGYVIIIKESFLDNILDKSIHMQLIELKALQEIAIDKNDKVIDILFKALHLEMKAQIINQEVIEGCLKALLSKVISHSSSSKEKNNSLEQGFIQLLSEELNNNVDFYARKLNTSAQNLNAVCQKTFHKTASTVITEHLIQEIKRQLLYTSKNISNIAYDLNFNDNSNFTKFFKRHTKLTPLQFRKTSS